MKIGHWFPLFLTRWLSGADPGLRVGLVVVVCSGLSRCKNIGNTGTSSGFFVSGL